MKKELSLLEVYNWATRLKDWTEFKSAIDKFYNGTPRSAQDESTYKLVKNDGSKSFLCGNHRVYGDEKCKTQCSICKRDYNEG